MSKKPDKKKQGVMVREPFYRRRDFWIGVVVVIIVAVPLVMSLSKNVFGVESSSSMENPMKTTPYKMYYAFMQDDWSTEFEYDNQFVEVTGIYKGTGEFMDHEYAMMADREVNADIAYIDAYFSADDDLQAVKNLSEGDLYTIRGQCLGLSTSIIISGCKLISVG